MTDFKKESLLLELLVEGEVSLYKYYSEDVEYFFYKKENKIVPLEYKVYKTENNKIGKNLNYKKTLRDELKCSSEKLSYDLDYKEKELILLFKDYHNCQNFKYKIYRNKKDKGKFNLRAKFGIGFSKIKPPITTTNNSNNEKNIIKFGVEFEYIFPFNNNKWAAFLESSYHSFDVTNSVITGYGVVPSSGAIVPIYRDYGIKYNSIENHFGVRHYMFLHKKNKIFMNTGLLYDLILNSQIDYSNSDAISTVSYFFGAGYDFKNKFSVEVRYNSTRDLSRFSPFTTNYNNISLKFGYNFL